MWDLIISVPDHCLSFYFVDISLAVRLGGPTGYSLLLAAVKGSLPVLFFNSATSYLPYFVRLLFHHYSAGCFHTCLKQTLFTAPLRGPGFETYRRRVVSLSKTLYSPKVLVNYPGSDGSVPI